MKWFLMALIGAAGCQVLTLSSMDLGADYDAYGGWKHLRAKKTGFFHTEKTGKIWWLVSPEGNVFFSKGINSIHPPRQTVFHEKEAAVAARLLQSWGMNTAGCWSDPALAGESVVVAIRLKTTGGGSTRFPDVFDPGWKDEVENNAREACAPLANNPWILGYFTDNELPWKHEDEAQAFLELFLALPESSPGHQAALRAQQEGSEAVRAFREKVAEIYFNTTAKAFRQADPHHLILGCRFAGRPPINVVAKMKGCADVISLNNYSKLPPVDLLRDMSAAADLPVLVSEFSFKGPAGDLPQIGSGPVKASQAERARGYTDYVHALVGLECCVGYHWFKWGETWQGVLQADAQPWPELTGAFAGLNQGLESER
jgi:hypothetical protein